ncbi:MAG: phytoene desaturase [Flavobacteriales bacterium]|nr:phytoene desaturase [Flavobacteriales bacterium]
MVKKVIVIGAGFSGLSVSTHLAKAGYEVTVLEKHAIPGGRARKFSEKGFTFDMGPSWYWMPDVFERYFSLFGKKVSDHYTLKRLSPSYRVFYPENEQLDVPSDLNDLYALFEKIEKGSAGKLKHFLSDAEYKYKVGIEQLVYKPGRSLLEFLDLKLLKGILKLDVLKPISRPIRSMFKDKRLIDLLEFPVLFLGAKPSKTPALYSLMNYADLALGTWYPKGGMHKIVEGMHALAVENGVKFEFEQNVNEVVSESGKVTSVKTDSGEFECDVFVSSADYHFTETKLLKPEQRNYSEKYWDSRTLAPSSLIYYLGVNKKLQGLLHHNLFFDQDFEKHSTEIYDDPKWPSAPQFYVCCNSVSDPTAAPDGMENVFILIPVAPDLKDTTETREKYYEQTISRLEEKLGTNIRDHVIYRRDYAHNDFISDYNSFKGNAYGLANTLKQTAIFKPSVKNKKLKNMYYTGQLTVPGPGVPPSLISGEVVAKEVIKEQL